MRSIEMYFYEYFQNDVLINFSIPFRQAEVITLKNVVPANRNTGIRETFYM